MKTAKLMKDGTNPRSRAKEYWMPKKSGKNTRTREITWIYSPFRMNVANNKEKNFFLLLNECFPKKPQQNSQLIIDKITIKLSYSCMANTKQKIDNHNRKMITNGGIY